MSTVNLKKCEDAVVGDNLCLPDELVQTASDSAKVRRVVMKLANSNSGNLTLPDGSELKLSTFNTAWYLSGSVGSFHHNMGDHWGKDFNAVVERDSTGSPSVFSSSLPSDFTVSIVDTDTVRLSVDSGSPSGQEHDWTALVEIIESRKTTT